jgi:hypothetical protein
VVAAARLRKHCAVVSVHGSTTAGRLLVHCGKQLFAPLATPEFLALRERYAYEPIQIVCHCDGSVLWERFKHRDASGERHPGHADQSSYAELAPLLLRGNTVPLGIGGHVIDLDTTDGNAVDYAALLATVRQAL